MSTGLAPWKFEIPFPGSLASTLLCGVHLPVISSQELANVEFLKGGVAALCPARSTSRISAESPASESGPPEVSTDRS